jgi:hypothetical protein
MCSYFETIESIFLQWYNEFFCKSNNNILEEPAFASTMPIYLQTTEDRSFTLLILILLYLISVMIVLAKLKV